MEQHHFSVSGQGPLCDNLDCQRGNLGCMSLIDLGAEDQATIRDALVESCQWIAGRLGVPLEETADAIPILCLMRDTLEGDLIGVAVHDARLAGRSWAYIADRLGVSRQGARKRFGGNRELTVG